MRRRRQRLWSIKTSLNRSFTVLNRGINLRPIHFQSLQHPANGVTDKRMSSGSGNQFFPFQHYDYVLSHPVYDSNDHSILLLLPERSQVCVLGHGWKFYSLTDVWKHWNCRQTDQIKTFQLFVLHLQHLTTFFYAFHPVHRTACMHLCCHANVYIKN